MEIHAYKTQLMPNSASGIDNIKRTYIGNVTSFKFIGSPVGLLLPQRFGSVAVELYLVFPQQWIFINMFDVLIIW